MLEKETRQNAEMGSLAKVAVEAARTNARRFISERGKVVSELVQVPELSAKMLDCLAGQVREDDSANFPVQEIRKLLATYDVSNLIRFSALAGRLKYPEQDALQDALDAMKRSWDGFFRLLAEKRPELEWPVLRLIEAHDATRKAWLDVFTGETGELMSSKWIGAYSELWARFDNLIGRWNRVEQEDKPEGARQ